MNITGNKEGNIFIFEISGRLDTQTYQAAEEKLMKWLEQGENQLIGDFSKLDFISSAGLRALIVVAKSLKSTAGKIVLYSLNDQIKEVFEITGISNIIQTVENLDEALKLF